MDSETQKKHYATLNKELDCWIIIFHVNKRRVISILILSFKESLPQGNFYNTTIESKNKILELPFTIDHTCIYKWAFSNQFVAMRFHSNAGQHFFERQFANCTKFHFYLFDCTSRIRICFYLQWKKTNPCNFKPRDFRFHQNLLPGISLFTIYPLFSFWYRHTSESIASGLCRSCVWS